ncbi:thioredoxin family protein [Tuberibacillus sp. Marseille-P3662]|uniref:thioredoxin family protein n=1 Tax=Tuberibacillus sp. Marseille-P3662 TaxID=1965358 RepID=UPI000A1CB6E0|nr:thioredoxin family protein [Tuberibacillus sp. Marseille-P3662]
MTNIDTQETLNQAINSDKPTIIKFEADWCPDCKRMNMFIGDIIEEHQQYDWYQIDRDAFPEAAQTYEVMGIPSLLVFQNGEKIAHLHSADAKSPEDVNEFLNKLEK